MLKKPQLKSQDGVYLLLHTITGIKESPVLLNDQYLFSQISWIFTSSLVKVFYLLSTTVTSLNHKDVNR